MYQVEVNPYMNALRWEATQKMNGETLFPPMAYSVSEGYIGEK